MKIFIFTLLFTSIIFQSGQSQEKENQDRRTLLRGFVMDASTLSPLGNSQIIINNTSFSPGADGSFAFYINRTDTLIFKCLGYKSTKFYLSDSIKGNDFIAGIYLNSDTISIGEVVIIPRFTNLKSEIMNSKSKTPAAFDNARYNVAISAYQGRNSQSSLGDPAANYEYLRQKQKVDAYEKGGIPSSEMVTVSPLLLISATYLLVKGPPEKPVPVEMPLNSREMDQIQKIYLEAVRQK